MSRLRVSIATVMMLVVTAAAASGLAARLIRSQFADAIAQAAGAARPGDIVAVLILAIVLTALALAARKGHTANQAMLQITLSCLGCLYVFSLPEIPSKPLPGLLAPGALCRAGRRPAHGSPCGPDADESRPPANLVDGDVRGGRLRLPEPVPGGHRRPGRGGRDWCPALR